MVSWFEVYSQVSQGTRNFMAGEVQQQAYLSQYYPRHRSTVPFRYNLLHDLESLWWIAVWFLFTFRLMSSKSLVHKDDEENFQETDRHMYWCQAARTLFPGTLGSYTRMMAFREFHMVLKFLPKIMIPSGEALDKLCQDLVENYFAVEIMKDGQFIIDMNCVQRPYGSCSEAFDCVRRSMEEGPDRGALETTESARKRKADESLRENKQSKRQATRSAVRAYANSSVIQCADVLRDWC